MTEGLERNATEAVEGTGCPDGEMKDEEETDIVEIAREEDPDEPPGEVVAALADVEPAEVVLTAGPVVLPAVSAGVVAEEAELEAGAAVVAELVGPAVEAGAEVSLEAAVVVPAVVAAAVDDTLDEVPEDPVEAPGCPDVEAGAEVALAASLRPLPAAVDEAVGAEDPAEPTVVAVVVVVVVAAEVLVVVAALPDVELAGAEDPDEPPGEVVAALADVEPAEVVLTAGRGVLSGLSATKAPGPELESRPSLVVAFGYTAVELRAEVSVEDAVVMCACALLVEVVAGTEVSTDPENIGNHLLFYFLSYLYTI
jgi:hypothetical protein